MCHCGNRGTQGLKEYRRYRKSTRLPVTAYSSVSKNADRGTQGLQEEHQWTHYVTKDPISQHRFSKAEIKSPGKKI